MGIDLLDTPLRVSWSLHGERPALDADKALQVADALGEAGVFFATLDDCPLLHPGIDDILASLHDAGVQVLLVHGGSKEEFERLSPGLPLQALLLDLHRMIPAGGPDFDTLSACLTQCRALGYDPSLLMTPTRSNLPFLPRLLDFCRSEKVTRFKLPNTKIGGSFGVSDGSELLTPRDLDDLRTLLGDDPVALRSGLALEIHDLFLWEMFYPERDQGRSEYGGCQAANSLGHVDERGDLHPCSSWPQPLGSLLESSLEQLWASPQRLKVRAEIAATPAGCEGCCDLPLCLGGCRGLARHFADRFQGRDPLCGGLR